MILLRQPSLASVDGLPASARGDSAGTVWLVPGPQVPDDSFHRLLLGRRYRDLWNTPIRVPVFDLGSFDGGLSPAGVRQDGSTNVLVLRSARNHLYLFRPLGASSGATESSPSYLMARFLPDRGSSIHPAGPLIASALLDEAGVLHPHPRMVALPGDSTLGPFRREFGGRLGVIEESADPGDAGFTGDAPADSRIVSTRCLLDTLETDPRQRLDSREFLAARMADFLMRDVDRDPESWSWVQCASGGDGAGAVWRPISPVTGRSFNKEDGVLSDFIRVRSTYFSDPPPDARDADGLRPLSRAEMLDRRLLVDLDRASWVATAEHLQARLNDAAIDSVVRAMPSEMQSIGAPGLAAELRRRRNALPEFARRYYAELSEAVDLRTSDVRDLVIVDRSDGMHVDVRFYTLQEGATGGPSAAPDESPYFQRRFDSRDTQEIRIYLRGGNDRVIVRGEGRDPIVLRIVGSGLNDELADSSAIGGVHFYDPRGSSRIDGPNPVAVDPRPFGSGAPAASGADALSAYGPDHGRTSSLSPWGNPGTRAGFFIGGQVSQETFGFRQSGFATQSYLRAGYSLALGGYVVEAAHEIRPGDSSLSASLRLRASSVDVSNFYGFGNDTPDSTVRVRRFYRVVQAHYQVQPSLTLNLTRGSALTFSLPVTVVRTHEAASGDFIRLLHPYGWGSYTEAGGELGLALGSRAGVRDSRTLSRPAGVSRRFDAVWSYYPGIGGLTSGFGSVESALSYGVGAGPESRPKLLVHLGGKKMWGRYPFAESAFLGGGSSLLGLPEQRYAGDASAFGAAELNLPLFRIRRLVPGTGGVLALAQSGRVFLSGEDSSDWHSAAGPGVWFSPFRAANRLSVTLVGNQSRPGLVFRGAFGF